MTDIDLSNVIVVFKKPNLSNRLDKDGFCDLWAIVIDEGEGVVRLNQNKTMLCDTPSLQFLHDCANSDESLYKWMLVAYQSTNRLLALIAYVWSEEVKTEQVKL